MPRIRGESKERTSNRQHQPLVRYLHRRRWRRWIVMLLVLLGVAAAAADRSGWLLYAGDEFSQYDGRAFRVVRVIDGDTLDIAVTAGGGRTERVRLWGIDTPEMARPSEGRAAEPGAEEATQFATDLAEGVTVVLELEPHRVRGRYGRLLAFVVLPDDTLLNERLLAAGLAHADDRWSHSRIDRFDALEREARQQRLGLWER